MHSEPTAVQRSSINATRALVSIVIVNYNGLRFLPACLDSLAGAFRRYDTEIIVVDNASSDGSQAWLRQRTDIVYVESPTNTGFTGGNNLGASKARGELLLFINNDTLVPGPLDAMLDALQRPSVGVSACRLRYGDQRQQCSFGYDHTPLRLVLSWLGTEKNFRLPTVFRRIETDPKKYEVDHDNLAWVSGACFAMRRSDWQEVGGFDTRFFMYCEDVDLCVRVRQRVLQVAYTAQCTVIHFEGAGKAWIGPAALRRTVRSYQLFTEKHCGHAWAVVVSVCLGSIFFLRSMAFKMQSRRASANTKIHQEKSAGYLGSAKLLFTSLSRASMKEGNP
ncbi:MAG: glycosyltransferase family 2 protein [Rhizobacter sp.]